MFEEIKNHNELVKAQIFCGFSNAEDLVEKAHQVGEIKVGKDGIKRVWTQLPNGKFDWRRVKKEKGSKTASDDVVDGVKIDKELYEKTYKEAKKSIGKQTYASLKDSQKTLKKHISELKEAMKDTSEIMKKYFEELLVKEVTRKKAVDNVVAEMEKKKKGSMTIDEVLDRDVKVITQFLEKKDPDALDAERYLDEEELDDYELEKFRAVANYFRLGGKLNDFTRKRVIKWANMADSEFASRKKRKNQK